MTDGSVGGATRPGARVPRSGLGARPGSKVDSTSGRRVLGGRIDRAASRGCQVVLHQAEAAEHQLDQLRLALDAGLLEHPLQMRPGGVHRDAEPLGDSVEPLALGDQLGEPRLGRRQVVVALQEIHAVAAERLVGIEEEDQVVLRLAERPFARHAERAGQDGVGTGP